jgi:hypothetical protein
MMTRLVKSVLAAVLIAVSPMRVSIGQTDEMDRGRQLYENHCQVCHDSAVHIRARSIAKSFAEIRQQIVRWHHYLELPWTRQEVDDVQRYLNEHYYHYSEPSR